MAIMLEFSTVPYPGLRPFRYDESDIFFGREAQIDGGRQRYGADGICVRDGAGWLDLEPTGLCRPAKFVAETPAIDRSRGEVWPA